MGWWVGGVGVIGKAGFDKGKRCLLTVTTLNTGGSNFNNVILTILTRHPLEGSYALNEIST